MSTEMEAPEAPQGDAAPQRRCPHCAEVIRPEALRCPHCRRSTKPPVNRLAAWALASNLLGFPVGSVIAWILGMRALHAIEASGGRQRGRGVAIASLVWAATAAVLTIGIAGVVLFGRGDRPNHPFTFVAPGTQIASPDGPVIPGTYRWVSGNLVPRDNIVVMSTGSFTWGRDWSGTCRPGRGGTYLCESQPSGAEPSFIVKFENGRLLLWAGEATTPFDPVKPDAVFRLSP